MVKIRPTDKEIQKLGIEEAMRVAQARAAIDGRLDDLADAEGIACATLEREVKACREITGCKRPKPKPKKTPGWQLFKVTYR